MSSVAPRGVPIYKINATHVSTKQTNNAGEAPRKSENVCKLQYPSQVRRSLDVLVLMVSLGYSFINITGSLVLLGLLVSHIHESIRTVRPTKYVYHCWKHIATKWPIKFCAGKNSSSQLYIMLKDRISLLQNLFLSTVAVLVSIQQSDCFQKKIHSCTKQEFRLDVKKLYGGLIDN